MSALASLALVTSFIGQLASAPVDREGEGQEPGWGNSCVPYLLGFRLCVLLFHVHLT